MTDCNKCGKKNIVGTTCWDCGGDSINSISISSPRKGKVIHPIFVKVWYSKSRGEIRINIDDEPNNCPYIKESMGEDCKVIMEYKID